LMMIVATALVADQHVLEDGTTRTSRHGVRHRHSKHYLISDQYNNRVVVVSPDHSIIWQFGDGSSTAGPTSVVGPNDAQVIGDGLYLISGTGVPSGSPETTCPNGCPDNRVLIVNQERQIVWQYGTAGCATCELNAPVQATWIEPHSVLITDQGNHRVILVNRHKKVEWQYGVTGKSGSGTNQLNNPNSAEQLDDGNILISDEGNNRVIEVDSNTKDIVWQFPAPTQKQDILNAPAFASRLENGHTLISDSVNNRIIEVDKAHNIVWTYPEASDGAVAKLNVPTRAVRLHDGHTLISDQNNNRVIEINGQRQIVFTQGDATLKAGSAFNELNGPYDAKVIGDFTGLTPLDEFEN